MIKTPVVLLLFVIAVPVCAQQFPITRLGVEEGLGHSIAYRTFQSRNGYLWLSTDHGITRYDGENLRNFTTQDGLKTNFIFDVMERDSTLILATFGQGVMTMKDNVFSPYNSDTVSLRYPISLEFFRNNLWAIDRYKHLYQQKGSSFAPVTAEDMSVYDDDYVEAYSMCPVDSLMFIGTSSGLFSYNGAKFVRFTQPEFTRTNIYNVKRLRNGNLLISNSNQLLEHNLRTGQSTELISSEHFSPSTCVLEDHEGNIWLSQINGDTYFLKTSAPGAAREVSRILEGVLVNHLYEDREQNVWLSTYGEGAWCIRSIHVRNYPIRGCILSNLMTDRGNRKVIVSTTNAGLKIFRATNAGFLIPVPNDPLEKYFRSKKNIVAMLRATPEITCFGADKTFYLWKDNHLDSLAVPSLISAFYNQPEKKRIWIGCRFGLAYYQEETGITYLNAVRNRVIKSITEDSNGNILLGTDKGIYMEKGNDFVLLPSERKLSDPYVNALFTDTITGVTWVATNSGLANIHEGRLQLIDHTLTRTRCNAITSDSKGRLWIGTVKGLLSYDRKNYQLITTNEGIAQSNINRVIYHPETDLITLLTSNGVSVLDAEAFLADTRFNLPDILIEEITSGGKPVPFRSTFPEIAKGNRDLHIFISTPIVKNRDKIIFSYRLNNDSWMTFNGRELSLKTLPYGDLDITIRVSDKYSNAEKTLTLSLFVPRPFYLRWWFIVLALVLLSATITGVVYAFSRTKNEKLVQEIKRLDIEHRALRNLLNPHFLYNAINSIHAFILQNDQRKTLTYLSKFSQLVRLNLELLSADRVPLDKEMKNISLYLEFEKLRFAEKLNYSIDVDSRIVQPEVEIPSFLIQPFLENAIWHGLLPREEGGDLLLKIDQTGSNLVITIDDNGVGINASLRNPKADLENKISMGINIMRDRIGLLKKINSTYDLVIADKADLNRHSNGTGTVVKITVPAHHK